MTEIIEANFHAQGVGLLRLLFQGVLKYFNYRKTREALAISNQELATTRAQLNSCQTSNRLVVAFGLFLLLAVLIAARRG